MEEIIEVNDHSQATQDMPPASEGDWVEKMVEVLIAKRAENFSRCSERSEMPVLPRVNSDSTVVMTAEEDNVSEFECESQRLKPNHQDVRAPKRRMRSIKGSCARRPMVIAPIVKVPPILPTEEFKENKINVGKALEAVKPIRSPGRQRVRDSIYKALVRSRPAKRHEPQPSTTEESKTCPVLTKFEGEFDLAEPVYTLIESPPSPTHEKAVKYIGPKPPPRSPIEIFPITEIESNDGPTESAEIAHDDKLLRPKLQYTKPKRNFIASSYPLPSIPEASLTEPRISCSEVIRSEGRASFSSLSVFKPRPCNRQMLESQLRLAKEHQLRLEEQERELQLRILAQERIRSISNRLPKLRKSIANLPKLIPDSMKTNRFSDDWFSLSDSEEGITKGTLYPERRKWIIGFCKLGLILALLIPIIVLIVAFHKKHNIVVGIDSKS